MADYYSLRDRPQAVSPRARYSDFATSGDTGRPWLWIGLVSIAVVLLAGGELRSGISTAGGAADARPEIVSN